MSATTDVHQLQRIEYPESDGKPLGETDVHRREIAQIIEMLTLFFESAPDIYVSGNLMFYYEQGTPSAVVSPDVFVVKGVPKGLRRTYKLWEEKQAPVVVFEISSRSTHIEDKGNKRALYAMLGVREYFLFDPLSEYLLPPLQGFRLLGEEYIAIDQAEDGALISQELGLRMFHDDAYLRLIDIATEQPLLRPSELDAARRTEAEARRVAEEEVERLRAELARLRGR
jgi:Uma2 family endonuclease